MRQRRIFAESSTACSPAAKGKERKGAVKKASDRESLTALGAEKLARLVLEASKRDADFKRLIAAVMAGAKGPKAVATVIDRKFAALNRATGFVKWDRAKTFASDLEMTLKAIVDELGRDFFRRFGMTWRAPVFGVLSIRICHDASRSGTPWPAVRRTPGRERRLAKRPRGDHARRREARISYPRRDFRASQTSSASAAEATSA